MHLDTIIITLSWGAFSGYLLLRILDSILCGICCLHGLLTTRWKRLVNRATPGQVKYSITLRWLLRSVFCGVLFYFLFEIGDNFVRRKFHFSYQESDGLIWGIMAMLVAALFLRASWRRLIVAWKITHEFDYAERRQRTALLKG